MKRGNVLCLGALTLCFVTLSPAAALELSSGPKPVTLDITETLSFDWNSTLDNTGLNPAPENVFDLRNRLNLRLAWDKLVVGVRVDAAWFPNPPTDLYVNDIRPEEMFISYRFGKASITLLDDYVALGRGLALTLRKVDELGFDLNLRGAHFRWRHKLVRLSVHAGITNVVNVDGVEEKLVPDPNDVIFAGRVETRPLKWLRIGAHGVDVERRHSEVSRALAPIIPGQDAEPDPVQATRFVRSTIVGGNIELLKLAKTLSLYTEVDALFDKSVRIAKNEIEQNDTGLAIYSSAMLDLAPVALRMEFKHYDSFDLESTLHPDTAMLPTITDKTFKYIAPPTLERFDQRVQNNTNVTAGRLKVDFAVPGTRDTAFISGAYFQDAPEVEEHTFHTYAGYEHRGSDGLRVLAQAGLRMERSPEQDLDRLRMIHIDLDMQVLLGGAHDLLLHIAHEFRRDNEDRPGIGDDYIEGTTYLTWNFSPHWSLTAQFEYLTNKTTESPYFPGGWLMYRFNESSFVRLFGGQMKGGLKCAGGICRIFPEFEGVKVEATARF